MGDAAEVQLGAYRLVRRIGAGGMGEVWLAEHAMLGRRAAIKLLNASFANRPDIVTRFFNEARAATAIADPGIVQIFDFGLQGGIAYIVMELLEGETLDARWRRSEIPLGDALRIVRQVAGSLGAAHAAGIVHRDLKPENIFLVRDPEVAGGERAKILDFGIAKLTADPGVRTQTSVVMGTPTFMSPEQCRGAGAVDQRADIYSLGCVLFALATGRPPFVADGAGDLIAMHLREPAPRARAFAPQLSPALDDLIARCLEKDPALRFASATALAGALAAVATQPPTDSPVAAVHANASAPTTLSSSAAVIDAPRTGARPWLAVAALAAVACIALTIWRLRVSPSGDHAARPAVVDAAVAIAVDAAAAAAAASDAATQVDPSDATRSDARAHVPVGSAAKPAATNQPDTTTPTRPIAKPTAMTATRPATVPTATKPDAPRPDTKPDATRPTSAKPGSTSPDDQPTRRGDEKPCNAPPGIPCER